MAIKYYNKLYREYALADMSRHREGKIGLRWRTEVGEEWGWVSVCACVDVPRGWTRGSKLAITRVGTRARTHIRTHAHAHPHTHTE